MQLIRHLSDIALVRHPGIRQLIRQRIEALGEAEFNSGAIGYCLVVEAGDPLHTITNQLGFSIITNRGSGLRYDQPGFTPSFELIEEYPDCFDMVFILSDDGYGVEVFIPKDAAIDAELQAMCAACTGRS